MRGLAWLLWALATMAHAESSFVVVDHLGQRNQDPLPYYGQDLAVAQRDPWLKWAAEEALKRFEVRQGRRAQSMHDKAVAVVDWIANTVRHPHFWPEDPAAPRQLYPDVAFSRLNRDPARIIALAIEWRDFRGPLCTEQNFAAAGVMNYLGLHARLVSVQGHDGLEYFNFDLGKWVWTEATFNEHYVLKDVAAVQPLGASELHELTLRQQIGRVRAVKHSVPSGRYPGGTYLSVNPNGFRQFAVTLYMNNLNGQGVHAGVLDTTVLVPTLPPNFPLLPDDQVPLLSNPANCRNPQHPDCKWGVAWTLWPQLDVLSRMAPRLDQLQVAVLPREGGPQSTSTLNQKLVMDVETALPYTTEIQYRLGNLAAWQSLSRIAQPGALGAKAHVEMPLPAVGGSAQQLQLRAIDNVGNATRAVTLQLRPTVQ